MSGSRLRISRRRFIDVEGEILDINLYGEGLKGRLTRCLT